jgi:hypothetical protein
LKKKVLIASEAIKGTVRKRVEAVKDSVDYAAQDARNVIKDIHGKTKGVKKDIKDGCNEITLDIHKTVRNISNELK